MSEKVRERKRETRRRIGGSPIPKGRSLKRMALSASSSSSLRLLYLPPLRSLPVSISVILLFFSSLPLSLTHSFSLLHCAALLSLTLKHAFPPSLSPTDLQPRFFLRFFLELRLPRIRQDYLSSAKGRSRLNLKHHLNKREVTARLFPAGRQAGKKEGAKRDSESLAARARAQERVLRLY